MPDVFSPGDVQALLGAAPPEWKTAILLGYYVGPRLGGVVSLAWDSVDLVKGTIVYTQGKTGKKVEVPIHPELEEHLLSIAGDSPRGFLCPTLRTIKIGGRSGLSKRFASLMATAGIDNARFSRAGIGSFRN